MSLVDNGQYLLEPYDGSGDVLSILRHLLADRMYLYPIFQTEKQKLWSRCNVCSDTEPMEPEPKLKPKSVGPPCLTSQPLHNFLRIINITLNIIWIWVRVRVRVISPFYRYFIWSSQSPYKGGMIICIQQSGSLRITGHNHVHIRYTLTPNSWYKHNGKWKSLTFQHISIFSLFYFPPGEKCIYHTQGTLFWIHFYKLYIIIMEMKLSPTLIMLICSFFI